MKTEIEVKFVQVDVEDMRKKLRAADAELVQPMRLMRRSLIEQPEHRAVNCFLRIRDEGGRTTLTLKKRKSRDLAQIDINNVAEIETEVGDFDKTVEIFHQAGWPPITYQESRRETWELDGAEVVIDEWPWLKPNVEIEGENEEIVQSVSEKLGFDWSEAFFGNIDHVYQLEYNFRPGFRGVVDLPEVRFDDPLPEQMTKI